MIPFRKSLLIVGAFAVIAVCQIVAQADQIVAFTSPSTVITNGGYPGVSFATPAGSAHNNITFNFLRDGAPTAAGTLFILTQEYRGLPGALTSGTAGFLAQSESISGGQFVFAQSLTLLANTTYFFYDNTFLNTSGYFTPPGLTGYIAGFGNPNFHIDFAAPNFVLSGTPVATVPEPATLFLLGSGLAGIVAARIRKRRSGKN